MGGQPERDPIVTCLMREGLGLQAATNTPGITCVQMPLGSGNSTLPKTPWFYTTAGGLGMLTPMASSPLGQSESDPLVLGQWDCTSSLPVAMGEAEVHPWGCCNLHRYPHATRLTTPCCTVGTQAVVAWRELPILCLVQTAAMSLKTQISFPSLPPPI